MQKSETARLLAFKHSVEGGEPIALEVEAWHEIVGHLDYDAVMEAAREHYRTERRLLPADLIEAVEEPVRLSSWVGNVTEQRLAQTPAEVSIAGSATTATTSAGHDRDRNGICRRCGHGLTAREVIDGETRCGGDAA